MKHVFSHGFSVGLALLLLVPAAQAKLNVVASLPDLAAIAREVGRDHIQVTSLAVGTEDPHFVDAKPSFIRVLNRADVLIEGGAELESGWLPRLVNEARNPKILGDAPGRVVAAQGLRLLEVPTGGVDRSQGDVHASGNPHYLLRPENCAKVAAHLAEVFGRVDPSNAAGYQVAAREFQARLTARQAVWAKVAADAHAVRVITYHKSFNYLLEYLGMELVDTVEPKPGIEPSPTHIQSLIPRARQMGVKLLIMEPNRPRKTAQQLAQAVNARLLVLPLMPGGHPQATGFFEWMDYNMSQIEAALKP